MGNTSLEGRGVAWFLALDMGVISCSPGPHIFPLFSRVSPSPLFSWVNHTPTLQQPKQAGRVKQLCWWVAPWRGQTEKDRQTITNLNLKQRETRLKLAKELQLTDELKRTNKNERENNLREKHELYIQLDKKEKDNAILLKREKLYLNNEILLKKENTSLKNKIEFHESITSLLF